MIIETLNLTKTFNGTGGCQEICLSVSEGQVFGFLGPNGAGKSTLVKTLVGLLFPTAGRAWLLGRPLGDLEARKRIGFLPEHFRYHEWMTGHDLLSFHAALYRLDKIYARRRIVEALELVGLRGVENQKVGTYSKGMQQRIGMACALLPEPALLFLDEPTSALDPIGRREVRLIINGLRQQGTTVFLNSHLLSEVEMISDRVAMINHGRIVMEGTLDELQSRQLRIEMNIGNLNEVLMATLKYFDPVVEVEGSMVRLYLRNKEEIPLLCRAVMDRGGLIYELRTLRTSLEDLFVDMIREDNLC